MKVAIITLHAINNYGSVFQALATENIFESLGCQVETIDYIRENAQHKRLKQIILSKGASPIIKCKQVLSFLFSYGDKRRIVLDDFREKNLHLSKIKYRCDQDLVDNIPIADIYCTGSDQTWNVVCQGEVPLPYFLHFAPEDKKKISFAASFGIDKMPSKYKAEVKKLLNRYYAISVRESTGVEILEDMGLEGTHVLDPTIAVGTLFWDNMASPRIIDEDYVLVYQLNKNRRFTNFVKTFSRRNHLKIVLIRSHNDTILRNGICLTEPTPEKLLSLFKYSKNVITDSFHATVFSMMFHCDFLTIYPPKYVKRLDSILSQTGLQNRRVTDFNRFDYSDSPIDYDKVDSILEKERFKTMEFVRKAIS